MQRYIVFEGNITNYPFIRVPPFDNAMQFRPQVYFFEQGHRNVMELLKQDYEEKIENLEADVK